MYIAYFSIEKFYWPTAKIIHLQKFSKIFKIFYNGQVLQYFYFVFLLKCGKELFSVIDNQHPIWQGP